MELVQYNLLLCLSAKCSSPDAQRRVAAGNGLGTGLSTTIKYRVAAGSGLGTGLSTASGAAGSGLGTTVK
jgi:hypothetical protein